MDCQCLLIQYKSIPLQHNHDAESQDYQGRGKMLKARANDVI